MWRESTDKKEVTIFSFFLISHKYMIQYKISNLDGRKVFSTYLGVHQR